MSDFKGKMHKNPISAGAPPDPLAGFKGPTSKGRGGRRREGEGWGKGQGMHPSSWKVLRT